MLDCVWILVLLALLLPRSHCTAQPTLNVPRFCVDEAVLAIFSPRLACVGGSEALLAPARLAALGAQEMFRAHELIAYDWLVLVRVSHTYTLRRMLKPVLSLNSSTYLSYPSSSSSSSLFLFLFLFI